MAVKPQGNNILAGTNLARAQIQSPNYAAGTSGWIIRQDGSAEFNNVTLRGNLVAGGVFVYNGTPGFGNEPIGWIAPGPNDPYGNVLPNAATMGINFAGTFTTGHTITTTQGETGYNSFGVGVGNLVYSIAWESFFDEPGNLILNGLTTYGKSGLTYYALNHLPGIDHSGTFGSLITVNTATTEAGPWTAGSQINMAGSNTLGLLADTHEIFGISGAPTLRLSHGVNLSSAAAFITATATGVLNVLDQNGLSGTLPMVQIDSSNPSVGNTASAGDITAAWTVPAHDGVKGTSYVIRALATMTMGQTTAETLTLGADIDGTQTPLATLGASFNGGTLSATYDIPLELTLDVDAIGTGTPQVYLSGPLGNTSANRLATNSANMSGHSNAASWDSTVSHTIAIYAQWGGAGGSVQKIQTVKSKFYREGP